MKCQIKHWDDNARKTTPIVFDGRPGRTLMRYITFLDEVDTKNFFKELEEVWRKLP